MLKTTFSLFFAPLHRGFPGEGPDGHFPWAGSGPDPEKREWGEGVLFYIFSLALSAAGSEAAADAFRTVQLRPA
jgi:hypothetical protein